MTGTNVVDPRQKLMEQAKAMQERISAPSGDKILLMKDKTFKLPGGLVGKRLDVVVLDFVSFNAYYDRPYDPSSKDKGAPACFALGTNPLVMVPSDKSPDKQSDACGSAGKPGCCPQNEFKTKGAGKACGNHYLLAVIAGPDAEGKPPEGAERYLLQVAAKGLKNWDSMVTEVLAKYGMGPICVQMDVWLDPSVDYQLLRFGNARPLSKENLAHYYAMQEAATARLMTEPDVSAYAPPPNRARAAAKKT